MQRIMMALLLTASSVALAYENKELDSSENVASDPAINLEIKQLAQNTPGTIVVRYLKSDPSQVEVAALKQRVDAKKLPENLSFEKMALNGELADESNVVAGGNNELDHETATTALVYRGGGAVAGGYRMAFAGGVRGGGYVAGGRGVVVAGGGYRGGYAYGRGGYVAGGYVGGYRGGAGYAYRGRVVVGGYGYRGGYGAGYGYGAGAGAVAVGGGAYYGGDDNGGYVDGGYDQGVADDGGGYYGNDTGWGAGYVGGGYVGGGYAGYGGVVAGAAYYGDGAGALPIVDGGYGCGGCQINYAPQVLVSRVVYCYRLVRVITTVPAYGNYGYMVYQRGYGI